MASYGEELSIAPLHVFLPHSNQKGKDGNRNREGSGHVFGQHEDMADGAWGRV